MFSSKNTLIVLCLRVGRIFNQWVMVEGNGVPAKGRHVKRWVMDLTNASRTSIDIGMTICEGLSHGI